MGRIETLKKGSRAYLRDGGDEAESDGTFLVTLDGRWDPRSREPKLNLCPSKWWISGGSWEIRTLDARTTLFGRALLTHGANLDGANHNGRTPLHNAAIGGYKPVVKLLLEWAAYLCWLLLFWAFGAVLKKSAS